VPYTHRAKSQATARFIKALKRYRSTKVHITGVCIAEEYGIPGIATAVNKKSAAGTAIVHKALNMQSSDQSRSITMATAQMWESAKI